MTGVILLVKFQVEFYWIYESVSVSIPGGTSGSGSNPLAIERAQGGRT